MDVRTRQERREQRRQRQRESMTKHGASLRRIYRDAILKRLANLKRSP